MLRGRGGSEFGVLQEQKEGFVDGEGCGGWGGKRWMMSGRYRRAPGPIGAGGQRKGVDFGLCTDKTGFCPSHFERKTKCCLSLS